MSQKSVDPIRKGGAGVRMDVRVTPRASRNQIGEVRNGRLTVRVTAPPVDSAANDAVVELVARALGVARRMVSVVSGQTSRSKTLEIESATVESVRRALDGVSARDRAAGPSARR